MCLNNGHCMSGNVQCNGEQDCDDWSDEDIDLCGEPEDTQGQNISETHLLCASGCDANHTASSGQITTPYYPNTYPSNTECLHILSQVGNCLLYQKQLRLDRY